MPCARTNSKYSEICILYNMENTVLRKKRTNKRFRSKKGFAVMCALCILLALCVAFLIAFNESIYPSMQTLAQAKVEKLAIAAMNESILSSLTHDLHSSEFVSPSEEDGRMYMLSTDSVAMNRFSYECAQTAQKKLADISETGISLSLGTVSGIAPLSGMGPKIKIRFTPAANVRASFSSTLEKSGINQTLYKVKIILTTDIYIVLPGKPCKISVVTDAAIVESVIVGEVPQVYTNVPEDEMLDLVPTEVP